MPGEPQALNTLVTRIRIKVQWGLICSTAGASVDTAMRHPVLPSLKGLWTSCWWYSRQVALTCQPRCKGHLSLGDLLPKATHI